MRTPSARRSLHPLRASAWARMQGIQAVRNEG
jgi:hypothetical protein